MINNLKPYPAMKDSGVPWLGDVPKHWEVLPNRALLHEVKERGHPDEPMLSVTITRGIIPQQSLLASSSSKDSSNPDRSAYKLVRPGDIAYNKMRAWQGALGASDYRGIVSPAYVVQRPRAGVNSRYMHYLMRTPAFAKEAERWSYGITSDMWSLRPEHFRLIYSCIPPISEQTAIVRFLDYADRRIRRYTRAKQELIKLLKEQEQAIIHRAVTRGLDPDVPLKDSGVEWLGDVPEHWAVTRVKHVARLESGHTPSRSNPLHWLDDNDIPWVSLNDTKALDAGDHISDTKYRINALGLRNSSARILPTGVVLFTRDAAVGKAAITTKPMAVSQHLIAWVCGPSIDNEYLLRVFYAMQRELSRFTFGATIATIGMDDVGKLVTPVPPIEEQREIAEYVARVTAGLRDAMEQTKQAVESARELRTRLTADVVTGKMDVREAAARLPDEEGDLDMSEDEGDHLGQDEGSLHDEDFDAELEEIEA